MKIRLAKSAGFCFGVKRAIETALRTARRYPRVEMLGDIVHNEDVVTEIKRAGVKKVKALKRVGHKVFLVRAHGVAKTTIRKARRLGYSVVDATCPMVKEIHRLAVSMENKGYPLIIIGDRHHDEVRGIIGQLKKHCLIIPDSRHIPVKALRRLKKAAVVVQSTQNTEEVLRIAARLKKILKDLKFFNTVCGPTRLKQAEIRLLPKENDVMIIIGSRASANTKRLYQISRGINKKSYWIRSKKDIRSVWLKGARTVGVAAGASTPESRTKSVVSYLKNSHRTPRARPAASPPGARLARLARHESKRAQGGCAGG